MEHSFAILEKKWNKIINEIYKKISINQKDDIPEDKSYALEYFTVKKIATKKIRPILIVINGPGGAGKTTVGKILETLRWERIPRVTDRPKRFKEVDGKDYCFITSPEFNKLLKKDKILAGKTTYDFNRGFLKENFKKLTHTHLKKQYYAEGDSSLQAFKEAKNLFNLSFNTVLNIFIFPLSFKELYRRLSDQHKEGNFTKEEFKTRLLEGVNYLSKSIIHLKDFPNSLYIVNDDINRVASILSLFSTKNTQTISNDIIPFFDNNKKLHGITTKNYAHQNGLLHSISVVYVFDSKNRLIVQKRSNTGQWDHSAAGHLNLGETYKNAAQRELIEELGISNISLSFVGGGILEHSLIPINMCHSFNLFTCIYDGPLKIQTEELLEIECISLEKLEERLKNDPKSFSGGFHATYDYYKKHK